MVEPVENEFVRNNSALNTKSPISFPRSFFKCEVYKIKYPRDMYYQVLALLADQTIRLTILMLSYANDMTHSSENRFTKNNKVHHMM